MDFKKINFKQPKYIYPLISFPFVLFLTYQIVGLMGEETKPQQNNELSLSLGETKDSILSKNDAYDILYQKGDNRTMLDGLDKEEDSLMFYTDNLNDKQKRYIDSLEIARRDNERRYNNSNTSRNSYNPKSNYETQDYERSKEIIRMLNDEMNDKQSVSNHQDNYSKTEKEEDDPVKTLRKQMLFMDSLEKSKNPEHQAILRAEEKLKKNREKMNAFLNSTLKVSKSGLNKNFNSISKEKENNFIKAVIDENLKGYLGSRIRFRLLEDIFVGKYKISKGAVIYGQISGFTMQRVNLNVVSIMNNGQILPINLSVYDIDGIQGLYIPRSQFREMMRELGQNSIQGTNLDNSGQGFFTSILSRAFTSTSQMIANIIRTNKAKLKYNTYIYLINEQELKQNENN